VPDTNGRITPVENASVTQKPNKWLAAVLGLFGCPLGLMYAGQIRWAGIYLLGMVAIVVGVYAPVLSVGFADRMLIGWVTTLFSYLLPIACALHSYRSASNYPPGRPRPAYSRWYGLLGAVAGMVFVVFLARGFLVEPFVTTSGSMLPTIPPRSHIVVRKLGYGNYGTLGLNFFRSGIVSPLERGDIVVHEYPRDRSQVFVRRLIGLPGDRVEYTDKRLTINGKPVETIPAGDFPQEQAQIVSKQFIENLDGKEYRVLNDDAREVVASLTYLSENCACVPNGLVCTVPVGHYFVLGDNRDNSLDSRYHGFVPASHIVGKVIAVLR